MPTSSFVESGFWCFDALFVPQQHPAREMQDTFYLSDPVKSLSPPRDYYERVSRVHEHGGFDSVGYRAPWSDAESHKLLLRTHTTASSAHMLYKLAARCRGEAPKDSEEHGGDGFRPAKLFSIDRVFRNETMDATHLAEFHQVEGVVADRGLTLADLIGLSMLMVLARHVHVVGCRLHACILQKNGYRKRPFQACIQPLHGGSRLTLPSMHRSLNSKFF